EANSSLDAGDRDRARSIYGEILVMLGVLGFKPREKAEAAIDEIMDILLEVRKKLREEKNYAVADFIRDRLQEKGIILEDTPEGTRWRRGTR
ncbi:MAG: cysteine--tRNA ligase, partial [Candidatus Hydrothermota bacterium]